MRTIRSVLVVAGAAWLGLATTASAEAPKPGAPAPEISVTGLDGKSHTLADFKGKAVVLEWNNFD